MPKYVVATLKPWNIKTYHHIISHYPGDWHLITHPEELSIKFIQALSPRYIFFPHWSHRVDDTILDIAECVCFHETDVPFGRGGSPLQNLIASSYTSTVISALRMTKEMDAGPVYLKKCLSLYGLAEEIYIRSSNIIASMILEIISNTPAPLPQEGTPLIFKRRTPSLSQIPPDSESLLDLFNHIRMLDAETYPLAFLKYGKMTIEFSRPALRTDKVITDATFKME
jgi:methionyl-tRNA formyltransferase